MISPNRGRPFVPPYERRPYASTTPPVASRLGWLLAANRIGNPAGFRRRGPFIAAVEAIGTSINRAQASRYESGAILVPERIIGAYEAVLRLRPYTLRGVAHELGAWNDPDVEVARTGLGLDDLIDAGLEGRVDGTGWLELTNEFANRAIHLTKTEWRQLTSRLVSEALTTSGLDHLARRHAIAQLMRRRVGVNPLIDTILELTDIDTLRAGDVVRQLRFLPGAMAARPLLTLAVSPTQALRDGAFDALSSLLAMEALPAAEVAATGRTLLNALRDSRGDVHVVDALLRLPSDERQPFERFIDGAAWRSYVRHYETVPARIAVAVSRELATSLQLPGPLSEVSLWHVDRLIREALFSTHHTVRHGAAALLGASPWVTALKSALRQEATEAGAPGVERATQRLLGRLDT